MDALYALVADHAELLLFLNILFEQAGLPIPAYPSLVVAGTLSQTANGPSAAGIFALAVLACVIADTAWFWAGRRHGAWLMRGVCRISLSPDTCIRKSGHLYRQLGPRLLLVAKFLPGAGALTTLMAGSTGTTLAVFLFYDIAGAAIWIASALMMGIVFEGAVEIMLGLLTTYVLPGILVVLGSFAAFLAWKWAQRARVVRRSRRVPRLQVDELKAMQSQGQQPILIDVRADGDEAGSIPGSIRMALNVRPRDLTKLPTDASVIIYCDCPNEISAAYLAERLRALGRRNVYALQGGFSAWAGLGGEQGDEGDAPRQGTSDA